MAKHFTVISYDRRGSGQSNTTQPYAVTREFETSWRWPAWHGVDDATLTTAIRASLA